MKKKQIKERIIELKQLIKNWDDLSKDNSNNIYNLSTSQRQDWIDELIQLTEELTEE
jgi:hypothetical protein